MRQTKVKSEKAAKKCSQCGARTWLFDQERSIWTGPWHFNNCPSVPGGDIINAGNLEYEERYAEEKVVPKEMGQRILRAIVRMMDKKNTPEQMARMKAAILGEIDAL